MQQNPNDAASSVPAPLQRIVAALGQGNRDEAVREALQALSSGVIPGGREGPSWLAGQIGETLTRQLLESFVRFPCFGCRDGRQPCEMCEGRGSIEGVPCETCLGTRLERCDFCNGSGLATINCLPEGFKPLVIKARSELAGRLLRRLLSEPLPQQVDSSVPAEAVKAARVQMLQIDRGLGMLENMLIAANQLGPSGGKDLVQPLLAACVPLAARTERRLVELVGILAEAYGRMAEQGGADDTRQHHERASQFYSALISPDRSLTGTALTHPFLHDMIRTSAGQPDEPAGGE